MQDVAHKEQKMTRRGTVFLAVGTAVLVGGIISFGALKDKVINLVNGDTLIAQVASGSFYSPTGTEGSGVLKTEARDVKDFSEISLSGIGVIHLRQASVYKLTIELDDNLLPLYETKVTNKTLELGFKSGTRIKNLKSLTVFIDTPVLEGISISGTSDVIFDTAFSVKNFRLDCSGTGKLSGPIRAEQIRIDSSGASAVNLSGTVDTLNLQFSGAGSFNGFDLVAKKAYISSSGAATIKITVQELLKVDISGASFIQYKGDPKVEKSISGIGSVKKAE